MSDVPYFAFALIASFTSQTRRNFLRFPQTRAGLRTTLILSPALYADPPLIGRAASFYRHNWRPANPQTPPLALSCRLVAPYASSTSGLIP